MLHRIYSSLALLLVLAGVCHAQFHFPEGKHQAGSLQYVNRLPVLRLSGTPEQIGEQGAHLVAGPSARLLKFPEELLNHLATPAGTKLLMPTLLKTSRQLYDNFPAAYRAEAEAILKHSQIDRDTFIFGNTVFDQKHLLMSLFGC